MVRAFFRLNIFIRAVSQVWLTGPLAMWAHSASFDMTINFDISRAGY